MLCSCSGLYRDSHCSVNMLLFKQHIDKKQIGHLLKVQYKSPSVSTHYFVNSLGAKTHGDDPISYKSNTM